MGSYYKGIQLFGDLYSGSLIIVNPHMRIFLIVNGSSWEVYADLVLRLEVY